MAQLATKRIMADIKNFNKSGLNEQGIFINYSDDNIYQMNALIFGPKDTPYANGNYLFDIKFPKDYPMKPPNFFPPLLIIKLLMSLFLILIFL